MLPIARALLLLAIPLALTPALRAEDETATYRVRQTVTLGPIEKDAKSIDWWVSIPENSRHQEILDIAVVDVPGEWEIVREPDQGNRFLHITAQSPGKTSIDAVVEFTLRRQAVSLEIDASKVGPLEPSTRRFFAEELALDAPHMEVTDEVRTLANAACGDEKNLARQAELLLLQVARTADHYSKDPTKPSCGIGDAEDCLTNEGGCCTDLHSLFIAMARSRGIPARLQMGYRMLAKNEGKVVDPGYRCWVEYFLPGYGWVSADIVEADAPGGLGTAVWFTGLTVERLWLNQGREFRFPGMKHDARVNHMSIAYAEVDGTPARLLPDGDLPPQLTRRVRFERVTEGGAAVGMHSGSE